ncbi:prolyl-tRNA synthetase associated domain-containing protein [Streptococcus oralis]|uniref:Prolyl-tRNA synthetase associated domain-containing protein n=1 Tax=Streptococcus oralis TaxID=1303 RepID=A0A7T2ZPE7_STROR|nr:prolyl-tRNA synthetase associated domain-containing protein [Streptococcus oralis]QPS97930.1 prolyl-tRNA synthetase associated domain-containing protein [Streptococcus oralis]
MDAYQQVAKKLQELGIAYNVVDHPPVFTTEQADSYIEGMEGVRTKSMFLTNRKKTQYYLLIMGDKKRLDMADFKVQVGADRIRMASLDSLAEKMTLPAGTVSPFGLLNNEEKDILVYFDKDIVSEDIMTFHPNTNEKTIFIKSKDLFRFLESIGFTYGVLILP